MKQVLLAILKWTAATVLAGGLLILLLYFWLNQAFSPSNRDSLRGRVPAELHAGRFLDGRTEPGISDGFYWSVFELDAAVASEIETRGLSFFETVTTAGDGTDIKETWQYQPQTDSPDGWRGCDIFGRERQLSAKRAPIREQLRSAARMSEVYSTRLSHGDCIAVFPKERLIHISSIG